jgi:1-acyl-sn-glycerol-3-phosphate acyltransferase
VRGLEHVPKRGPVVVAANHVSVLDPFVLSVAIERPLHYLGKAELWRCRPLVPLFDALGAIPVTRDAGDEAAIAAALDVLGQGEAIGIFPQGSVSHETWRRGAARLALAGGAPLLPVRILGTDAALARGRVGFPRIAVLIGEPIPVDRREPTAELASALTARLRAAVESLGG